MQKTRVGEVWFGIDGNAGAFGDFRNVGQPKRRAAYRFNSLEALGETSASRMKNYLRFVWSRRAQNSMSIEYLIRSTAFDPEVINSMLAAYDRVRKALSLADGDDCANWSVATKIAEQVWLGERNPDWMCRQVLKELGPGPSSPSRSIGKPSALHRT
jgi:hypothetical protein